ncbi:hypothetical protein [Chromobacterium violaceum]|uniref:hypothetical protein n=1 Tax=Chromobacterium violaceum TaxID=536 RepID=UPI001B31B9FD|nr:hypothetical protein [Chromobacterium violaceum]MBP4047460.1 hypothetical protein [Chromobacterium violaceum]
MHKIEAVVLDFSDIDLTGQTFRYPYNTESQKHLTNVRIINIENLYKRFAEFYEESRSFGFFIDFILDEYSLGTYTKNLSRKDIEDIAKFLPEHTYWIDEEFISIKKKIKDKYKIGSKELTETINLIKKHKEFSVFIGIENKISEVTIETLRKLEKINSSNFIKSEISKKEISGLLTILEMESDAYHCENYDWLFQCNFDEMIGDEQKDYILSKVFFNYRRLIEGMNKLGQRSLANEFNTRTRYILRKKHKLLSKKIK